MSPGSNTAPPPVPAPAAAAGVVVVAGWHTGPGPAAPAAVGVRCPAGTHAAGSTVGSAASGGQPSGVAVAAASALAPRASSGLMPGSSGGHPHVDQPPAIAAADHPADLADLVVADHRAVAQPHAAGPDAHPRQLAGGRCGGDRVGLHRPAPGAYPGGRWAGRGGLGLVVAPAVDGQPA